jgi:hypothetical protein
MASVNSDFTKGDILCHHENKRQTEGVFFQKLASQRLIFVNVNLLNLIFMGLCIVV